MSLRVLHRFGFALLLGLVALTASSVAQNQLSSSVLFAALNPEPGQDMGGHYMPDGTYMAGPMSAMADCQPAGLSEQAAGHTHRGHADCDMCGVAAAMAALSVPALDIVLVPDVFAAPAIGAVARFVLTDASYAPYASRAPPQLTA